MEYNEIKQVRNKARIKVGQGRRAFARNAEVLL